MLLPGEVVPLHIFEERYKLLVQERLDGGEFGVVLVEDGTLRECGCSARVAELLEELDDGRLNILVEGGRRFRILELRTPDDPEAVYLSGLIGYYEDEEPEAPEELRAGVLEVFRKMLVLMGVDSPKEPAGEAPLSFRVAAAFDFGAALKQELLEALSESQRLETLLRVMDALLPQLRLRKEREEAIRGNGKGY
ncbi:MAG: LON peptidase substrate-binding domain-containing protein [Actinobacteria bacterium]|nr:LON peptidase substrate-binding domain-containing protein [Actinomycetota bacterium]